MSTVEELSSESELSELEDLGMPTPSSGSSETSKETTSPAEIHQAMAQLLTFANHLNESTSQLIGNLTRFKEEAAASDAPELAKCKKETERLKQELNSQCSRMSLLKAEMKFIQVQLSSTEKALAKARLPTFQPDQIGFFDPDLSVEEYGAGDVVSKGGTSFYREVESFLEAAAVAERTIPVAIVRKNLHLCFLGSARTWYASVLCSTQRDQVTTGEGLDNWATLLRRKWGPQGVFMPSDRFKELEKLYLNCEDMKTTGSITDFVVAAVREAGCVGMESTYSRLVLAYMRMAPEVQKQIGPPRQSETVDEYIIRADQSAKW